MAHATMSSLKVRALSPRLQEKARKELGEDPSRTAQDIEHIKQWLKKQPHLHARTDDQWLLTFLRGCKFSLERTKQKLDMYYTMRTLCPEYYTNRDPMLPELQEIWKLGNHLPLPTLDDQGRRVNLDRVRGDPTKMKFDNVLKANLMALDVMLLEDDDYIVSGDVSLIDLSGISLQHMVQMTPSVAKKMTTIFQEAYPVRPQGMNYINMPSFFTTIFNLMQSFLKDKFKRRLHVHGTDMESLYKQIPQKNLPLEYGGNAGSIDEITAVWKAKIESYRDWFLEDEQYKSNEKKRVGKPKTQDELFGLEGSFRQLNVD